MRSLGWLAIPALELRPGFKDCHRQGSGVALLVVTIDGPEACCDVDDAAMICAVLEFSYAGTDTSPKLLAKNGFYTANLGDCAQTIAARGVLERLGLTAADVPGIDRDTLPDYDGPPTALLMNGVFYDRNFPVSTGSPRSSSGFARKARRWCRRIATGSCAMVP